MSNESLRVDGLASDRSSNDQRPSFGEAVRVWMRVALLSFGGPAGQIAVMHRILVEEKRWISEERFLHALNYCMLLPGPEAQQLATYIGWLLHRTAGGLLAGTLFVLPGFLSILGLSVLYAVYNETRFVEALFFGIKPAVLAVVIEAVLRIGRRVLKNGVMYAIAAIAFVSIFFLHVPFPIVVLVAGLVGWIGGTVRPDTFGTLKAHGAKTGADEHGVVVHEPVIHTHPSLGRAVRVGAICIVLWFGPILLIASLLNREHVLVAEGVFFSKAAVVTFGGAYSVLAYLAQEAVSTYHWLLPGEMLDGLGMAETTPGPLIMVVQFVGFLGAYRNPEPFSPLMAGFVGSVVTTWVTFVPCFLWIFLGAPSIEALRGRRRLNAALSTITAAVVGAVLNLAVWFALHVLFETIHDRSALGVHLLVPEFDTIQLDSVILAVAAMIAIFRFKWGMLPTLGGAALLGMATAFIG